MSDFQSSAQFGQDRFPYELIVRPEGKFVGSFLDIGCNAPDTCNNTFALENLGWRGALFDIIPDCVRSCAIRKSPFILGDTTSLNWRDVLQRHNLYHDTLDYASIDVDAATLPTLKAMPLGRVKFRCITIEHDFYIYGSGPRDEMRRILIGHGYDLVCADVKTNGQAFEDWYARTELLNREIVDRFRCEGKEWSDIFELPTLEEGV